VRILLEIEDRSSKLCENAQTKNHAEMKSRSKDVPGGENERAAESGRALSGRRNRRSDLGAASGKITNQCRRQQHQTTPGGNLSGRIKKKFGGSTKNKNLS
jgi:hypothetical protein